MQKYLGSMFLIVVLLLGLVGCAAPATDDANNDGNLSEPLRVLTYNIHHGAGVDGILDLERIAKLIRDSGADLVALQEVDIRTTRTGGIDQLDTLARLTGMHGAFAPFMDFQGGQYGLGVLSVYPIDEAQPIVLPPGQREPRSALAVTVTVPEFGRVQFVSLHFDWLQDDSERYAQAVALNKALDGASRVILAGDFNDQPGSRTMQFLSSAFANAQKPAHARFTFPSGSPEREIDFVMFRPMDAFVASAVVLDESIASDHRPVLAILEQLP